MNQLITQLSKAKAEHRKANWARYCQLICKVELPPDELDEFQSIMQSLGKSEADVANDSRVMGQVAALRTSVGDRSCIERLNKAIIELERAAKVRQEEIAAANEKYRLAKVEELQARSDAETHGRDRQQLRRLLLENPELFSVES
jgi:hypothetical protein